MFDKIEEKVHDIRQEPEHIRVRYVWGSVTAVMFVVIFIWLISIKINFLQFDTDKTAGNTIDLFQNSTANIDFQDTEQSTSIDGLLETESVISETEEEI